ncbi:glycosyl hydrolase 5 family protein-like isoform X1 [Syzygium oleosum]|uniref:glycosyl hydrolase 5 family protein-like isoform X1 n=1 Tax=Syzygium oleosum TaxID=219896 RepID=UPI0024BA4EF9|nr:glycosyl hydrolase 5 family protein-like isoform X1 [Syzygium oleosum]
MRVSSSQAALILYLLLVLFINSTSPLPLSTDGRWIVDATTGRRVKLACVNWAAHLEPMLAEGLDKKPLGDIVAKIRRLRFNCVRLTWATHMFTQPGHGERPVEETLDALGLAKAKGGVARNNPLVLNMTHVEAYDAVVDELGKRGVMVVLDNHVSKPKWCCPYDDGNGFFGDEYFDPEEWLRGLVAVAGRFNGKSQVVGMSMRNELRGSRQNEHDWYQYVRTGATKVHKANPNVLVIVSGLSWASDLGFLQKRPMGLNLDRRLVYEAHWYSFSGDRKIWEVQPVDRVCADAVQRMDDQAGFLVSGPDAAPLFLGEFGFDQSGKSLADDRFLSCFMGYAAGRDLDWALWVLQGSYYYREGVAGPEETFGVLDFNWDGLRYPKFKERFQMVQTMSQDPSSNSSMSYIMYHPQSGHCIRANNNHEIGATECRWSRWSHDRDGGPIRLVGTPLCLKALGDGLVATLSDDCSSRQSAWRSISNSKLHVAAMDEHGNRLCLEKKSNESSVVLTRKCICVDDDSGCMENPQGQWFKFVPTNT